MFERQNHGVSIIVPFFNSQNYLQDALDSVEKQTLSCILEVVIGVDVGSRYPKVEKEYSFEVIVVKNQTGVSGAGATRFSAIQSARYRYIAFLDADDIWSSKKLELQIAQMTRNNLAFSYGGYCEFDTGGIITKYIPPPSYSYSGFLRKSFTIGCLTVVFDRSLCPAVFLPDIKRRNDYLMWNQLLLHCKMQGQTAGPINDILGYRRKHSNNLTKGVIINAYYQYVFYRKIKLGRVRSLGFLLLATVNTIWAKRLARAAKSEL